MMDLPRSGSTKVLPFEFRALEVCLESACKSLEWEVLVHSSFISGNFLNGSSQWFVFNKQIIQDLYNWCYILDKKEFEIIQ